MPCDSSQMENQEDKAETRQEKVPVKPRKWLRLLWFYGTGTAIVVGLGLSIFDAVMIRKLGSKIDDVSFNQTSTEYARDNDLLTPDVGVIQFMRRGYSVTFDRIDYTANGLEVSGTLGNPTQLTLSGINFKLSARPYLYQIREKVEKNEFYLYSSEMEIGSGQTAISYLGPGKTATFTVTIPNVKQTKEGIQIVATFSNERYAYY